MYLSFGCARSSLLRGLSLVVVNEGYSSCGMQTSHCSGFFCCGAGALGRLGSVVEAPGLCSVSFIVVAHGLRCSAAYEILLNQESINSVS